jgi:hypothetical protein
MSHSIRTIFAAGVIVALVACADGAQPPVAPIDNAATPSNARSGRAFTITGRARVEVRRLGVGGPLGQLVQSDVGQYTSSIEASGFTSGQVTFSSGVVDLVAIAGADKSRGLGRWERSIASRTGNRRVISRASAADRPADELEIWDGNAVSGRAAKVWVASNGAWRLGEYTFTAYDGGRPVMSVRVVFDEPTVSEGAAKRVFSSDLSGAPSRALAPTDRASFDEDLVCEVEVAGMEEAMRLYGIASASMFSCLAGPWQCFAAFLAVCGAATRLDGAVEKVEICLKKAE